jgi:Cu2+-exporting ATPase
MPWPQGDFCAAELTPGALEPSNRSRKLLARVAVSGFAASNIMLLSVSAWSGASVLDGAQGLFHWLSALIALPTVAYAGQPFFASAWTTLSRRRVNMDVPISLAILLSATMSLYQAARGSEQVYFDACVSLLFFLLIGRYLDEKVRMSARSAAHNLISLKSEWAHVIGADGSVARLPAAQVLPGMRISVAAGERFPADGRLETGSSAIDESLITGETLPRPLKEGDRVYAGSLNLSMPVTVIVESSAGDTLIDGIARMMSAAEQARGHYVRLADRAARYYAPFVHTLAALSFAGWMISGATWQAALTISIAVLIITCPCALALAVPAVQVAACSRLFADGILVKAADGLERLAEVDTVVFDKTGTLTHGVPTLANGDGIADDVLKAAGQLASSSRHPYARAVAEAARARFGAVTLAPGVQETPGAGLVRYDTGGIEERLGSAEWCGIWQADRLEASLWYLKGDAAAVAFLFADELRPHARETVASLRSAGYRVLILSGDRPDAVHKAADALGIEDWSAQFKPADKIARLDALKAKGYRVLMVGDGLNDGPALAAAHASLSPSTAADISQTASDAVFQGASLETVVRLLETARKIRAMSLQNFAVAFAYNIAFVPFAIAGFVTPLVAAIAMSSSSILVTVNALRLRTMRLRLAR